MEKMNTELDTCQREGCNKTFERGIGKTEGKRFCSDSCRYKAHRNKARSELMQAIEKAVRARVRL